MKKEDERFVQLQGALMSAVHKSNSSGSDVEKSGRFKNVENMNRIQWGWLRWRKIRGVLWVNKLATQ